MTTLSDNWPVNDLQEVEVCPVCGSESGVIRHHGVKDWAFQCAPGTWQYWGCPDCDSLYLNPRPTPSSIGRAYASYYTHAGPGIQSGIGSLKLRWKNERLSLRLGHNIEPRLHLPKILGAAAHRRANVMDLPFGWNELADMPPGKLMDVGCGSGFTVMLAQKMGWEARGLEIDSDAVQSARAVGLLVDEGGYEQLVVFPETFDCIVCSHVIEHVYDTVHMIRTMYNALRPGGYLLMATPNVFSDMHQCFGIHWRGLEAPRHLVLFSERTLTKMLQNQGFSVESRSDLVLETARESARIARRAESTQKTFWRNKADNLARQEMQRTPLGHDFIKMIARKLPESDRVGISVLEDCLRSTNLASHK